jgi:glycosyltransferase involved in cell wall biosynthesis
VRAVEWPESVENQVQWLYEQLASIDPDIFVPNISVSGCYAGRYLREAGRPTIAGHRSDDSFNWGMAERFCQRGDEWAVSALFCVSDELTRAVRQSQSHRTIVTTIPSGVPLPEKTADQSGPLRLVFAGRLEQRQKRIGELVTAVMVSMKREPLLTAKIIGDGSQRLALEKQIAESGYADRFRVTGFVPPEKLHNEILAGNVLVLLSDFEGVPGGVMDGMACGLVPVCLDIPGGLRELVIHEETGLLVSDREQSFQNAISRLGRDIVLRRRLSANARNHIENRFSLKVAADRWEQLCSELLANAGPRRPIRFPSKPVLPPPSPGIAREDKRRPARYAQAYDHCLGFPRRAARWVTKRLIGPAPSIERPPVEPMD